MHTRRDDARCPSCCPLLDTQKYSLYPRGLPNAQYNTKYPMHVCRMNRTNALILVCFSLERCTSLLCHATVTDEFEPLVLEQSVPTTALICCRFIDS